MPRSRGGPAPAPRRPVAAAPPPRPAQQQQQTRPASTAAATRPPTAQAGPPATGTQQGPGLFGQMASTAAGVAVGSSIGHAIGGFFGGGSSAAAPVEQQQQAVGAAGQDSMQYSQQSQGVCGGQVVNFRQCMDQNNGDLNICGWYLDQLKACQAAASQY